MEKRICLECGLVFDAEYTARWRACFGEYEGQPCYEDLSGCPRCHGDYDEAVECEGCGEYFSIEILEDHLCENCRENCKEE